MPNGSLEKFICSKRTLKTDNHLGWGIMHEIAIGIARGLEYLHSRFWTRKTIHQKREYIINAKTRGTIGYTAPEVFSRNFSGVSYKSDVHSHGMLVLEMVGGREKEEVGTNDPSSEK
ncbi:hypothetical protein JCGZ_10713 [Jatropha curcas]|uniref:Protein kinase domain-containing protein n=1 Tax=Jatropha curcas TaxID=180498 RepID=A0A067KTM4_JATCU|nr:hypothetical protein JCGZ_10713 [Jatropha curcas]